MRIDSFSTVIRLYSFFAALALVLNHGGARAWRTHINHFVHHGTREHRHRVAATRVSPPHLSEKGLGYRRIDGLDILDVEAAAPMLKGALKLGASKPKSIIAIFPGVGGSAENPAWIGLGKGWYEQNPDAQVIIFDADAFSADRALSAVWNLLPTLFNSSSKLSNPVADGYDANYKSFDASRSRSNFFGDVLLSCCNDVSYALQELLLEYGLTDENLILAGFSQGASIAAYTGFMRGVAGIILMGGPGAPQSQLLPALGKTKTQVSIISGDSDPLAPHIPLANAFLPYGGHVNILPGISHQIVKDHVELGGSFISSVLANASAASANGRG